MTVASTENRVQYTQQAGGSVTSWGFSFVTYDDGDLEVYLTDTDGADALLVLDSDYTVSLNANQSESAGGSIVIVPAITAGHSVTIRRVVSYTQETDLTNGGSLDAEVLERRFDLLTMQAQQLAEVTERCAKVPVTSGQAPEDYLGDVETARDAAESHAAASAASAASAESFAADADAAASRVTGQRTTVTVGVGGQSVFPLPFHVDATLDRFVLYADGVLQYDAFPCDAGGALVSAGLTTYVNAGSNLPEGTEVLINSADTAAIGNVTDLVAAAEAAEAAAVAAKNGADAARAEAEAALSSTESVRDSAVSVINNEEASALAAVQGARDLAVQAVTTLPNYAFDKFDFMRDWHTKLLSNEAIGSEGDWTIVFSGAGSLLTRFTGTGAVFTGGLPATFLRFDSDLSLPSITQSYMTERMFGTVFGDSGRGYRISATGVISGDSTLILDPANGDVTGDFSGGRSYDFYLYKESSDSAEQNTGSLSYTDVFVPQCPTLGDESLDISAGRISYQGPAAMAARNNVNANIVINNVLGAVNLGVSIVVVLTAGGTEEVFTPSAAPLSYDAAQKTLTWSGTINASGGTWTELKLRAVTLSGGGTGEVFNNFSDVATSLEYSDSVSSFVVSYNSAKYENDTEATVIVYGNANNRYAPQTGASAVFNPGNWAGSDWSSNLLSDRTVFDSGTPDARIQLPSRRPLDSVAGVRITNASGVFVGQVEGSARNPGEYAPLISSNITNINVGQWSALGYTSERDMLLSATVEIVYTTKARRVRPMPVPSSQLVRDLNVYYRTHPNVDVLVAELIDWVPRVLGASYNTNVTADPATDDDTGLRSGNSILHTEGPSAVGAQRSVKYRPFVYVSGGTLHVGLWFKELVESTTWGDDGAIVVSDYVKTQADDNGNVVRVGCVGYDTGIVI